MYRKTLAPGKIIRRYDLPGTPVHRKLRPNRYAGWWEGFTRRGSFAGTGYKGVVVVVVWWCCCFRRSRVVGSESVESRVGGVRNSAGTAPVRDDPDGRRDVITGGFSTENSVVTSVRNDGYRDFLNPPPSSFLTSLPSTTRSPLRSLTSEFLSSRTTVV